MTLMDQLQADLKAALRAREEARLTTIRSLIATLKEEEGAKHKAALDQLQAARGVALENIDASELPQRTALGDAEIEQVIGREVKKRQDSVAIYRKANRAETAAAEEAEIAVLRQYLPTQLSADDLRPLVQQVIDEVGAASKADLKKVMPVVMSRYRDRADGRTLNQLVQELLS